MAVTELISFTVIGTPKPKGSMTQQNRGSGRLIESVAGSAEWRQLVARTARDARVSGIGAYTGAVSVVCSFLMPTESVTRNGAGAADLDKLVRNVLDALSACTQKCDRGCRKHAGIYVDDVQVVGLTAVKQPAGQRRGQMLVKVSTIS